MAVPQCDRAIRVELGISQTVAARLAGVDRRTLAMWEAGPQFVSETTRAACAQLYALLADVLRKAPGKRE